MMNKKCKIRNEEVNFSPIDKRSKSSSPKEKEKRKRVSSHTIEKTISKRKDSSLSNPTISSISSPEESSSSSDGTRTISTANPSKQESQISNRTSLRHTIEKLTNELNTGMTQKKSSVNSVKQEGNYPEVKEKNFSRSFSQKIIHSNVQSRYFNISTQKKGATEQELSFRANNPSSQNSNSSIPGKVQIITEESSSFSHRKDSSQVVVSNTQMKPIKLRFSDPKKHPYTQEKNHNKKEVRKRNKPWTPLIQDYFVKLDNEELLVSHEQMRIINMFEIKYKRPKGNREFFIQRELPHLRDVKPLYREIILDAAIRPEDVDICPQYGEKLVHQEDGSFIWRQLDLHLMKLEKRRAFKQNIKSLKPFKIDLNGEETLIADRAISQREPIDIKDEGRVHVIYHGAFNGVHIFVIEIFRGGKLLHRVEEETVILRVNNASKNCLILFGATELDELESDMIIFVPKKTELTLRNDSNSSKSVMKVELSIFTS